MSFNLIEGDVVLYDANGKALSVENGVAKPANQHHLLLGGEHKTDGKTYHARMIDDPDTASLKRVMVESRLAPGSAVSLAPIPANPGLMVRDFLRNGGSKDMNVDGSGTPVAFTYDADATVDIALVEVRFIFNVDALNMKSDDFGSDIPLTNGCKFEVTSNGTTTELANFLVNEDFLALPARSAISTIYDGPSGDQLVASFYFGGQVKLYGGTSDNVKMTIRDEVDYGSTHKVKLFWAAVYGVKDA